jgi:hypothetical protein
VSVECSANSRSIERHQRTEHTSMSVSVHQSIKCREIFSGTKPALFVKQRKRIQGLVKCKCSSVQFGLKPHIASDNMGVNSKYGVFK